MQYRFLLKAPAAYQLQTTRIKLKTYITLKNISNYTYLQLGSDEKHALSENSQIIVPI